MVNTFDVLRALAEACSLVGEASLSIRSHGTQVAYAALRLAQKMNVSREDQALLVKAALVHDVGVSSTKDFHEVIQRNKLDEHSKLGAALLSEIKELKVLGDIVLHHHTSAGNLDEANSSHILSNIILLADELALKISSASYPLWDKQAAVNWVRGSQQHFFNSLIKAFGDLAKEDAFWLDLGSENMELILSRHVGKSYVKGLLVNDQVNLCEMATMFSKVIDSKSAFTKDHSIGVTNVSVALASHYGFNAIKRRQMVVAGLLHDLGKLSVPDEILEKPGSLSHEETLVMRKHTYHTKSVLLGLRGFTNIANWASHHHERLDRNGYPFKLGAKQLDIGSRIVAVADTFQALNQDRPYRQAMAKRKIVDIMERQVTGGALDHRLVGTVLANYEMYHELAMSPVLVSDDGLGDMVS